MISQKSMTTEERLYYSIDSDDTACLSGLVACGVDVNHIFYGTCPLSKSHWSALHICCEKGRYQCARILLEARADPNIPDKYGQTPLMYAVCCGWSDLVQLLLNHGVDVTMKDFRGRTVMHAVAATDDVRILEMLLGFQGDIHQSDLCGVSPLWLAASSHTGMEMLKTVLKHTLLTGDLNARDTRRGRNALQAAIMTTETNLYQKVKALVEKGIDTQTKDFSHFTPCMNVVKRWQEAEAKSCLNSTLRWELKECFLLLVREGCDANKITTGMKLLDHDGSVLHMATRYGISELVKMIVTEFNADVNCRNSKDQTPLYLAVKYQHFDAAKILIENRADLYQLATVTIGQRLLCASAFQFALELGHVDVAILLYHAGYNLRYEEYLVDELDLPEVLRRNSKLKDLLLCLKLKQESTQPGTLHSLCFRLIWYMVIPRKNNRVNSLPVPQHIKDDLCYKGIY